MAMAEKRPAYIDKVNKICVSSHRKRCKQYRVQYQRLTISYASTHAVTHEEFNLNTSVVKNKGPLHTTKINHPLREKNYVGLVYVLLYTKEAITWF